MFLNCCQNSYLKKAGGKSVFRLYCPGGDHLLSDVQKLDTVPYCGGWETYIAERESPCTCNTKDVLKNNGKTCYCGINLNIVLLYFRKLLKFLWTQSRIS